MFDNGVTVRIEDKAYVKRLPHFVRNAAVSGLDKVIYKTVVVAGIVLQPYAFAFKIVRRAVVGVYAIRSGSHFKRDVLAVYGAGYLDCRHLYLVGSRTCAFVLAEGNLDGFCADGAPIGGFEFAFI